MSNSAELLGGFNNSPNIFARLAAEKGGEFNFLRGVAAWGLISIIIGTGEKHTNV